MTLKARLKRLEGMTIRGAWQPFDWDIFRARMAAKIAQVIAGGARGDNRPLTEQQAAMLERLESLAERDRRS